MYCKYMYLQNDDFKVFTSWIHAKTYNGHSMTIFEGPQIQHITEVGRFFYIVHVLVANVYLVEFLIYTGIRTKG